MFNFLKRTNRQKLKRHQERGGLVFFDVETPNLRNDRVCSIGYVVTDYNGCVQKQEYHLVNPECTFDRANIDIHSIREEDVKKAPTFLDLWDSELKHLLKYDACLAYNASFDLNVIGQTLHAYNIQVPNFSYIDVLNVWRSHRNDVGLRLSDACNALNIELEHHNAFSDAMACSLVFWSVIYGKELPQFKTFDYTHKVRKSPIFKSAPSSKTKELQSVVSVFSEIVEDGVVSTEEGMYALSFLNNLTEVKHDPLITPVITYLQESLEDGWISEEESSSLKDLMEYVINPVTASQERISINGNNFVITGDFDYGSRSDVETFIKSNGGEVQKSVTKKTNYVVVGNQGSEAWSMGNYGQKVKKAIEWQKKGISMQVIKENDLFCLTP